MCNGDPQERVLNWSGPYFTWYIWTHALEITDFIFWKILKKVNKNLERTVFSFLATGKESPFRFIRNNFEFWFLIASASFWWNRKMLLTKQTARKSTAATKFSKKIWRPRLNQSKGWYELRRWCESASYEGMKNLMRHNSDKFLGCALSGFQRSLFYACIFFNFVVFLKEFKEIHMYSQVWMSEILCRVRM